LLTIYQTSIAKLAEKLNVSLSIAQLARRPLELHHHKPLAIKMAIPKFEESYNPNKHYDPDRERTENAKLQKELKREKKVRFPLSKGPGIHHYIVVTNMVNFRVLFASFEKMRRLLRPRASGRRKRKMLRTTRNTSVSLRRFKERKEWSQKLTSEKRSGARRARNSLSSSGNISICARIYEHTPKTSSSISETITIQFLPVATSVPARSIPISGSSSRPSRSAKAAMKSFRIHVSHHLAAVKVQVTEWPYPHS